MQVKLKTAIGIWLCSYTAIVWATTTLAQDLQTYDWASLVLAACAGLVGGAGRTLITQLTKTTFVGNTKVLLFKDLAVAFIAGSAVFLVLEAYNTLADKLPLIRVDRGLRVFILAYAGYSRMAWLALLDSFASDVIDRFRKWLRGGEVPPVAVNIPTAVVTEGDSK